MELEEGFRLGDRLVLPRQNRIVPAAGAGPEGGEPGEGAGEGVGEEHLEPKVMAVLVCLARHAGEVVPREAFYDQVWDGAIVTDHALTHCISELRKALGDDPANPRFIATVPKRGYRLVTPVEPVGDYETASIPAHRVARPDAETAEAAEPLWLHGPGLRLALVALAVALAVAAGWLLWSTGGREERTPGSGASETVAALPFEDLEDSRELSYLRLALPDEITTVLTRAPSLAVRPFRPDLVRGGDGPVDPVEAGHAVEATTVITGHYYVEGGAPDDGRPGEGEARLSVTLEAVHVPEGRLTWRTRVTAPLDDVLSLRERIASRIRTGLIPALGGEVLPTAGATPASAEAYRLYLQALGVSRDPGPNLHGIELLQRVVELDPDFAPAWDALALRHHRDAEYGQGGAEARGRARRAARRALELDPELMAAAQRLVALQVEAGHTRAAYRRARELVERRPESAQAHFALAYVSRFGGLLEESQDHCERALELDPYHHGWRSCGFSYMATGELDRAEHFISLDPGSYWSNLVLVLVRMRQGDEAGALRYAHRLPPGGTDRHFLEPCLQGVRGAALEEEARAQVARWKGLEDPEPGYWVGGELAYCERTGDALDLLSHAVEGGFCSYPALDLDPIWDPLREHPEFRRIRERAIACHRSFVEAVERVP